MSATVTDRITCPECEGDNTLYTEFNHKMDEDFGHCERCGYVYEGDTSPRVNHEINERTETRGVGVGNITMSQSGSSCVSTLIDQQGIDEFIRHVNSVAPGDIASATMTLKRDEKWYIRNILDDTEREWDEGDIQDED